MTRNILGLHAWVVAGSKNVATGVMISWVCGVGGTNRTSSIRADTIRSGVGLFPALCKGGSVEEVITEFKDIEDEIKGAGGLPHVITGEG